MGIHVEIHQIANGFTVELFCDEGPATLDKTVYCESWDKVKSTVEEWRTEIRNFIEETSGKVR